VGSNATPSPEPTPLPEAAALIVEASEFAFKPSDLTTTTAASTAITLVNKGTLEHDFTVDALDLQIAVPIGKISGGTLTDPAPGTYQFYCAVPGHREAGMVGTLVVTE